MKNYQKILAVLAVFGMCFAAQAQTDTQQAIQRLEQQIKAQQAQIDALKAESSNTAASLQKTQEDYKSTLENKLSGFAHGKVKFGATFFGDFAGYPSSGYAPSFLDNQNTMLAPGNDGFNAFDARRAYLNFIYTPNDRILLRVTPDISSGGDKQFRLKYGYVDVKHIFGHQGAFGDTTLRAGQGHMPLIDWEEGLMGMRYVYKTPWDYMGVSSTFIGAALKGPIKFGGREYLDYHFGIYNVGGYHDSEVNGEKQVMGRVTFYPFGTKKDRRNLGITVFDGYTYSSSATNAHAINRGSALIHYATNSGKYRAGFEYDFGRGMGVLSTSHSFGSVPNGSDYSTVIANNFGGDPNPWMQGFDFFGSAGLGNTPFSLFGIWQYVQPDTNVGNNPLDYERVVGGIQYKVNKHFRMAVTSENYLHAKSSDLYNAVYGVSSDAAAASAATKDTNAVMLNVEYNY